MIDGWQSLLHKAIEAMLSEERVTGTIPKDHLADTPSRVVRAYAEFFSGLNEDPREVLKKQFSSCGDRQMITQLGIDFVSVCAHHLVPIIGKVHFSYLPAAHIIGLSKIPRLIDILAKRPQVQENLSNQIVDTFDDEVRPVGCAVVIDAIHMCVAIRGVKKFHTVTRTVALRGKYLNNNAVRQEFLNSIPKESRIL